MATRKRNQSEEEVKEVKCLEYPVISSWDILSAIDDNEHVEYVNKQLVGFKFRKPHNVEGLITNILMDIQIMDIMPLIDLIKRSKTPHGPMKSIKTCVDQTLMALKGHPIFSDLFSLMDQKFLENIVYQYFAVTIPHYVINALHKQQEAHFQNAILQSTGPFAMTEN